MGNVGKQKTLDPRLHHQDGTHRETARTSRGEELEWFDGHIGAHLRRHEQEQMTNTTERNWTEPIGELSMAWATEIAKQFPTQTSIKPYTPLVLPPDRHAAMIEYTLIREKDSRVIKILTYVKVCLRDWEDRREIDIQVYSPTGGGCGGMSTSWVTAATDGSSELEAVLREVGTWAWDHRLNVANQI